MALPPGRSATPEAQLRAFIAKFRLDDQRRIRALRIRHCASACRLRTSWSGTTATFSVIEYSPAERPTDAVLSMAARANRIGLCFIYGAGLPDRPFCFRDAATAARCVSLDRHSKEDRARLEPRRTHTRTIRVMEACRAAASRTACACARAPLAQSRWPLVQHRRFRTGSGRVRHGKRSSAQIGVAGDTSLDVFAAMVF